MLIILIFYQLLLIKASCPVEAASLEAGERLCFFADKVTGPLIDWISGTLSQGYITLQSKVKAGLTRSPAVTPAPVPPEAAMAKTAVRPTVSTRD
jgi:hypothetical protein